jgi:hypothetical protein
MKICSVKGCSTNNYSKGLCVKHYYQDKKGMVLDIVYMPVPLLLPKVAPKKKRCHARMKDGTQCIRRIERAQMCFAHWREAEDRERCELREHPIEAEAIGFEGNEAALIAAQEQANG